MRGRNGLAVLFVELVLVLPLLQQVSRTHCVASSPRASTPRPLALRLAPAPAPAAAPHPPHHHRRRLAGVRECVLRSTTYYPSGLEQQWVAHVDAWAGRAVSLSDYCGHVAPLLPEFKVCGWLVGWLVGWFIG